MFNFIASTPTRALVEHLEVCSYILLFLSCGYLLLSIFITLSSPEKGIWVAHNREEGVLWLLSYDLNKYSAMVKFHVGRLFYGTQPRDRNAWGGNPSLPS